MPHIQVLDQITIDKIAAGEVIERPAANFFSVIIFIFVSNILAYFWCFYQPLTTRRFFGYFC